MNIRRFGIATIAALLLAGCEGGQPLIFVSTDTLGVDISASANSAQPLTLTLGFKENNASFVPVTAFDKAGAPYEIRGCDQVGLRDTTPTPCPVSRAAGPGSSGQYGKYVALRDLVPDAPAEQQQRAPDAVFLTKHITTVEERDVLPPNAGPGAWESSRDSLSVYSSFNAGGTGAGGTAGPQLGVNLGKVFATGVAAQNLTSGQGYLLRDSATSQCLAQLANAVGAKVTEATALKVCGPPTAPAQTTR